MSKLIAQGYSFLDGRGATALSVFTIHLSIVLQPALCSDIEVKHKRDQI